MLVALIITLVVRRVETVPDRLELVEAEVAVMVPEQLHLSRPQQELPILAAAAAAAIADRLVQLVALEL